MIELNLKFKKNVFNIKKIFKKFKKMWKVII